MAKTTISWTDYSWPVIPGCRHASPGCLHCYAERLAATRLKERPQYRGLAVWKDGRPQWTGESRMNFHELAKPLHWRKPRRIFVCQTGDLFYERNSNEEIAAVFGVMSVCRQHLFQILTKRPERALEWFDWIGKLPSRMLSDPGPYPMFMCQVEASRRTDPDGSRLHFIGTAKRTWPLPNVAIGVTVEDAPRLKRIDTLKQIPAAIRFVSFEPLLELVLALARLRGIDQAILGCESGPKRRHTELDVFRDLVQQCDTVGCPPFVKQLEINGVVETDVRKFPRDLRRREVPPELDPILRRPA